MRSKIIVRIKGGLGNQLFCYAAARRLALVNRADLVLDDITGFIRDWRYRRSYELDNFAIPCRRATPQERMEPFERGRRALAKWRARRRLFPERRYIEQHGNGFEERLLTFVPKGTVYVDGLWQDERYFIDVGDTIRADLAFRQTPSAQNRELADRIDGCQAVALHVRWFDPRTVGSQDRNLGVEYYEAAVEKIEQLVPEPHYFVFSSDIPAAAGKLKLPHNGVTYVDHNGGDESAISDLRLMTRCKHFILANSTFSWWGSWLSPNMNKFVITPDAELFQKEPTLSVNRVLADPRTRE